MMINEKNIVYEDKYILAVHKPSGLATQTSRLGEKDLISEVKNYLHKKRKTDADIYVGLINRLDQPVEGIVLLGLTREAAAGLSEQLTGGGLNKRYYAGLSGIPENKEATVVDFMIKDSKTNTSAIVDDGTPGARKAVLEYKVISEDENAGTSVVRIHLVTGRHHQIRVQMSGMGYPLLGDTKYGSEESEALSEQLGIRRVALCACSLEFEHPVTTQRIELNVEPEGSWWKGIR